MVELQLRLASGKRLVHPSDDPLAAVGVLVFRAARSLAEQHQKTAEAAQANLRMAESALGDMGEILKRANEMVVRGATATTDAEARAVMARQIRTMQDRFISHANSPDFHGNYLFAGFEVQTKPFAKNTAAPPPLVYQGDGGKQVVEVGPGLLLQSNMLVDEAVIAAYEALEDAAVRLEANDASGLSGVTLTLIKDASAQLLAIRGDAGARTIQFEEAAAAALRRYDQFTEQISVREDADMTETIVQLQQAQIAYQAALMAFQGATGLSLLNFLRG